MKRIIRLPVVELKTGLKHSAIYSNANGEVLVAARKADELVRNLGATWDQIIAPSHGPLIAPPPAPVAAKIALLRQHIDPLTDWEVNFLACRGAPRSTKTVRRSATRRGRSNMPHVSGSPTGPSRTGLATAYSRRLIASRV
jgi:hypothetical protein